jgi:branched-chain amino acid transport system ATP-binding protein
MDSKAVVTVEKLSTSLDGRPVLAEVDMFARAGEVVVVFGHNGAGKSTLLRCIMGILPHDSGTIELNFASWKADPRVLFRSGAAYLPQSDKLFLAMTVEENLLLSAEGLNMDRNMFEQRCGELASDFPVLSEARKKKASRLSGGERQQIALARTLLSKPKLMLLDEPSIGLAPNVGARTFAAIRAAAVRWGAAVILVEHRIREALQIADRAYALRQGAVVFGGTSSELLDQPEKLRNAIS